LGKRAEAAEAYRRGLKLAQALMLSNPGDAPNRAFAAYFMMRLGDRAGADRELVQALHFGSKNRTVVRRAVLYYEATAQREKSLELLQSATADLIRELNRQPDVVSLRQDSRFAALLPRAK
jgi:Flp pilus assembly protein TadD